MLVEYVGDETAAARFPHGNAVTSQKPYVRTLPHVLNDIRTANGTAHTIYKGLVKATTSTDARDAAVPRNPEQVRNTLKIQRNSVRSSRDAIYNVHEVAFDTGFVHEIKTYPDLSIIMYHPDLLEIFRFVTFIHIFIVIK